MSPPSNLTGRPQTLWDAIGQLNEIQTQEKIALDNSDIELFQQLLEQQAQAWQVVYREACELIAIGKAPPDMSARLQKTLNIHHDHERQLQRAKEQIQQGLRKLQSRCRAA